MSKWSARRKRFRELLAGGECLNPGSVFDPMSARIAEHVGYEFGMFAGSTASMTVLGAPDHIVLTLSEFVAQCQRINRAFSLPLMVDADHGYGNALNVMRTVEELEIAGVSGMSIEDTDLPHPSAKISEISPWSWSSASGWERRCSFSSSVYAGFSEGSTHCGVRWNRE